MDACVPAWSLEHRPCPNGVYVKVPLSTFTWPFEPSALDWVAAFYCTMPFNWFLLLVVLFCYRRGLREALLLFFYPFLAFAVILATQHLVHQPRPSGTCLTQCGMPSGHSLIALGLTTVIWCECAFSAGSLREAIGVALLLLPVPWAKVHLHDHYPAQAFAGGLMGVAIGLLYFAFVRVVVASRSDAFSRRCCVVNNYPCEAHAASEAPPYKRFLEER
mmetsp:Transcript_55518/g.154705  ORF Transcript_55518/g.154705 Transcript_55518/m.154705 type:complete len:218 (+) Transcript_55518:72-725(+)